MALTVKGSLYPGEPTTDRRIQPFLTGGLTFLFADGGAYPALVAGGGLDWWATPSQRSPDRSTGTASDHADRSVWSRVSIGDARGAGLGHFQAEAPPAGGHPSAPSSSTRRSRRSSRRGRRSRRSARATRNRTGIRPTPELASGRGPERCGLITRWRRRRGSSSGGRRLRQSRSA